MRLLDIDADTLIPETATVSVAKVGVNDVVVVECDAPISMASCERIKAHFQEVWPDRKVVVLADGLRIKVVREVTKCVIPGDTMRLTVPLLQEIHDHGTRLCKVVNITEEEDGSKTLQLELAD